MEQEVKALLEKGAIEYVPHSNRENGFYSRYFIVPKKHGGLRPILDLRVLNDSVMQLKFKMLHNETNRATDQIRGLVCHDRSQGCIDSHSHPSVSQEVSEVHFWEQSIPISGSSIQPSIITLHFHEMRICSSGASAPSEYSHNELHRRLVDSSSVASVGSSASRCRSGPHERVGVTAKCQKSVTSPLERTFLGVAWDSTSMQACMSPARIESILSAVKRIRLGQSLTVKQL